MRRSLILAALALVLLGFELATGAVSFAVTRLVTGFAAVLKGDDVVVSPARYLSGLTLLLTGVAVLGMVLWSQRAQRSVTFGGAACPRCGSDTQRVRRFVRHRILSRLLELNVTRRHCQKCGWSGLTA